MDATRGSTARGAGQVMISASGWTDVAELVHLATSLLREATSVIVNGPASSGEDRLEALRRVNARFQRRRPTAALYGGAAETHGQLVVGAPDRLGCRIGPPRSVTCSSAIEALRLARRELADQRAAEATRTSADGVGLGHLIINVDPGPTVAPGCGVRFASSRFRSTKAR